MDWMMAPSFQWLAPTAGKWEGRALARRETGHVLDSLLEWRGYPQNHQKRAE
jgi:hypothetical protein